MCHVRSCDHVGVDHMYRDAHVSCGYIMIPYRDGSCDYIGMDHVTI